MEQNVPWSCLICSRSWLPAPNGWKWRKTVAWTLELLSLPVTWLVYGPAWGAVSLVMEDLRRLLLLAQFLNSSQELYLGRTRTNTNANPFGGKCPLELQTKPLLLNYCIWGHRGSQGSGELTFHTRAMGTVRTGKLLLRSRSATHSMFTTVLETLTVSSLCNPVTEDRSRPILTNLMVSEKTRTAMVA